MSPNPIESPFLYKVHCHVRDVLLTSRFKYYWVVFGFLLCSLFSSFMVGTSVTDHDGTSVLHYRCNSIPTGEYDERDRQKFRVECYKWSAPFPEGSVVDAPSDMVSTIFFINRWFSMSFVLFVMMLVLLAVVLTFSFIETTALTMGAGATAVALKQGAKLMHGKAKDAANHAGDMATIAALVPYTAFMVVLLCLAPALFIMYLSPSLKHRILSDGHSPKTDGREGSILNRVINCVGVLVMGIATVVWFVSLIGFCVMAQ